MYDSCAVEHRRAVRVLDETPITVHPPRRLTPRTALLLELVCLVVASALVVNLVFAIASDRDDPDRIQPPGAGPGFTPLPPMVSQVEDFQPDGPFEQRIFAGIDAPWTTSGNLVVKNGVLRSHTESVATIPMPADEVLIQTVAVSPAAGWTVAFSYENVRSYWGVRVGVDDAQIIEVSNGRESVRGSLVLPETRWVEVRLIRRDGVVLVSVAGPDHWSAQADELAWSGQFALLSTGAAAGGIDHVAVRPL